MTAAALPAPALAPDPHWITRIYNNNAGEDFLGLLSVQANITGYLLPGIITITPRARYYAFYCWLLHEFAEGQASGLLLGRFMKRREQIFALANMVHIPDLSVYGLTGHNKLRLHLGALAGQSQVALTMDDFVGAARGGYDDVLGVLRALHATEVDENRQQPIQLLPLGQRLAASFTQAIQETAYFRHRHRYDTAGDIDRTVLEEYGSRCHLSAQADGPDRDAILEALFAFEARPVLPEPGVDRSPLGNMRGTLGLFLDMFAQAQGPFRDAQFREAAAYGLCSDFPHYQPAELLRPFLAVWRAFQLREYYTYALYALWSHFLSWLKQAGPAALSEYCGYFNRNVDTHQLGRELGLPLSPSAAADESLSLWLAELLDAGHLPDGTLDSRCAVFAGQYQSVLREQTIHEALARTPENAPARAGYAWLQLSTLFLRLNGIRQVDPYQSWGWMRRGGTRRRSLDLFMQDVARNASANASVADFLHFILRDYLVNQHTLASLEKWRDRDAYTFRFDYRDGRFDWVGGDRPAFTASRFDQASRILSDLGLWRARADGAPELTRLGQQTLARTLESLHAV